MTTNMTTPITHIKAADFLCLPNDQRGDILNAWLDGPDDSLRFEAGQRPRQGLAATLIDLFWHQKRFD